MGQTEFINILLSVLGFIGILAVTQLVSIAKSLGEIKVELKGLSTEHANLKERVCKLEDKK